MCVCVPRLHRQSPFRMSNSITLPGTQTASVWAATWPGASGVLGPFNYKFSIKIFPLALVVVAFIVFDICPRGACKKKEEEEDEEEENLPFICHLLQNNRIRAWPGTTHAVNECDCECVCM